MAKKTTEKQTRDEIADDVAVGLEEATKGFPRVIQVEIDDPEPIEIADTHFVESVDIDKVPQNHVNIANTKFKNILLTMTLKGNFLWIMWGKKERTLLVPMSNIRSLLVVED